MLILAGLVGCVRLFLTTLFYTTVWVRRGHRGEGERRGGKGERGGEERGKGGEGEGRRGKGERGGKGRGREERGQGGERGRGEGARGRGRGGKGEREGADNSVISSAINLASSSTTNLILI